MNCFDLVSEEKTYHGNYQVAKSGIASIKYLTKPSEKKSKEELDPEPLEIGDMDWKQELSAKECKKKILGKRITEGEPIIDILKDGNHEMVYDYERLMRAQKQIMIA